MCSGWAKLPDPFSEKNVRIGGFTIELKIKRDLTANGPDEDDERGDGLLTKKHDDNSHAGCADAPAQVVEMDIKNA